MKATHEKESITSKRRMQATRRDGRNDSVDKEGKEEKKERQMRLLPRVQKHLSCQLSIPPFDARVNPLSRRCVLSSKDQVSSSCLPYFVPSLHDSNTTQTQAVAHHSKWPVYYEDALNDELQDM